MHKQISLPIAGVLFIIGWLVRYGVGVEYSNSDTNIIVGSLFIVGALILASLAFKK